MSGTILIVDDVPTNRMILRAKLSAAYYDVIQADNGQDALDKVARLQPDLVLLDVMMPDIDGFAVCRRIKDNPETAHLPVVMVTALDSRQDRLRGLECGADDFLTKPISDLALLSRVRNLLRAKFMFDELRLRDATSRALGLDDPMADIGFSPPPGRVAMVPRNPTMGLIWTRALAGQTDFTTHILNRADDAMALAPEDLPDVFLVHARLGGYGDGLRLVSHLRSRPHTRHCGVVLVVPEHDQKIAAKGLDLGASDYVFEPVDPSEMIVRLKGQIRRKQISDRLRASLNDTLRLAVQDPLTGLYNRRYAMQHLARMMHNASASGRKFALMLLDIDRFKQINDSYGHAAGDHVLREFARRIQENLRGVDMVSRIGGEEFLVAMPDTTEAQARKASERLRRVIERRPFPLGRADATPGTDRVRVTVSVGVVMGDANAPGIDHLLQHADEALYASKNEGRNMVTMFGSAA